MTTVRSLVSRDAARRSMGGASSGPAPPRVLSRSRRVRLHEPRELFRQINRLDRPTATHSWRQACARSSCRPAICAPRRGRSGAVALTAGLTGAATRTCGIRFLSLRMVVQPAEGCGAAHAQAPEGCGRLGLKDATAYNVAYDQGRPRWIDASRSTADAWQGLDRVSAVLPVLPRASRGDGLRRRRLLQLLRSHWTACRLNSQVACCRRAHSSALDPDAFICRPPPNGGSPEERRMEMRRSSA